MFDLELWHIWVIAAVLLFIFEMFTPAFVVACFGVGCLASALAAYIDASVKVQIAVFSISTAIVLFLIRPIFLQYFYARHPKVRTNVEALIGQTALVEEKIDPATGQGRVKVSGDSWRALAQNGEIFEEGQQVKIVKLEGMKLVVSGAETGKEN